jgi:hypothetical protein
MELCETSATKFGREGIIIPKPVASMTMVINIKMNAFLEAILIGCIGIIFDL